MPDLIGQSLGRYHILEQLGEGGMAIVYKAYDTRLEREVAIKVIRTEKLTLETIPKALKRFDREAKALGKLTHPNIVPISDYGEFDGKPFLVMPHLPGGTLKEIIKRGRMPWQKAVILLAPIAHALDYAHRQNIIHRDIKPSNVLIGESGTPMLSDFGVAKVLSDSDETHELTGTGMGVGTPEYMAPEQFQGQADERADIYALGVVMYEMVTGRKPYIAETPAAVIIKQATEPLPRPNRFAPDLPVSIDRILIKALAKSPKDRYQKMGQFGQALEGLVVLQEKENKKLEEKKNKEALEEEKRQQKARKKQEEKKTKAALLQKKREEKARIKEEKQEKQQALQQQKREELEKIGQHLEEKPPEAKKRKKTRNKIPAKMMAASVAGLLVLSAVGWLGFSGALGEFTSQSMVITEATGTLSPSQMIEHTLTSTPEPTFTPTSTPTPSYTSSTILFEDDFENGNLDGWSFASFPEISNPSSYVEITSDGSNNHVLVVNAPESAEFSMTAGLTTWENYSLQLRVYITEKNIIPDRDWFLEFFVRKPPKGCGFYNFGASIDYTILNEDEPCSSSAKPLASSLSHLSKGYWISIRIDVFGSELRYYINDDLIHQIDDTTYTSGNIAFNIKPGAVLYFDDILVTELLPNTDTQVDVSTPLVDTDDEFGVGSSWKRPADGMTMMYIPAGEFLMGSNDGNSDEKPIHAVYLDAYWMDETEVTNRMYSQCVNAGECSQLGGSDYSEAAYQYPVEYVDWNDSQSYCEWVGGRLPTEAEWEKAARGGLAGKKYPWGDTTPVCTQGAENGAQYEDCNWGTVNVGSFSANGYGLYDMTGNVSEWVADWYRIDYYKYSPDNNPEGLSSGDRKVLRGGSWDTPLGDDGFFLRSAYRGVHWFPNVRFNFSGFRCARDIAP